MSIFCLCTPGSSLIHAGKEGAAEAQHILPHPLEPRMFATSATDSRKDRHAVTHRMRAAILVTAAAMLTATISGCTGGAAPGDPGSAVPPAAPSGDGEPQSVGGLTSGQTAIWARVAAKALNPAPNYIVHSETKAEFIFPNGAATEVNLLSWCSVLTMSATDVDEIIITADGTSQTCEEIFAS